MNRRALSSKSIGNKISSLILTATFLVIWIVYFPHMRFFVIGAIVVAVVAIMAFRPRITIEYDDDNMYVRDGSDETTVELKDVTVLKITNFTVNQRNRWAVIYRNDGIEEEVAFYPGSYFNLDAFADLVQKQNPEAKIIRKAGPFDSDS